MSAGPASLGRRFRSAFLTGASAGLGQAFARMLLEEGVQVWGTARSADRLAELAASPGFHPVVLDLHHADQTERAYAEARTAAGGFDLVINNAGYGLFARFAELPFESWQRQLEAMLVQPLRLAHAALRDFRAKGGGTLVNVASLAVEFPLPYMSGYNVAKAGLAALSESLLIETAGSPVSVIDFRPGDYRTGFNRTMSQLSTTGAPAPEASVPPARVWQVLEANLAAAPLADRAAADLRAALRRGARGTVRSGSFFQATLAPVLAGWAPEPLRRAVRWRYFGIG